MRKLPRGTWSYAALLILLFSIATLAVRATLIYLHGIVNENFAIVAAVISFLSLGFMLIAGAFGLWAIQFAAGAESRRRIGQLVGAMDYLQDGLLVLDKKAQITGANPAALDLAGGSIAPRTALDQAFSCLAREDVVSLLEAEDPSELEKQCPDHGGARTLRFRSQPSTGVTLLLVSDVTRMHSRRERSRHAARLQLVGQLARGVAYDFNNLLCAISGHASVLPRMEPGSTEMKQSLEAITSSAERGIALASHIMTMAEPVRAPQVARRMDEHINAAAASLRESLPANWTVEAQSVDVPPIGISGLQIEQVTLNLGLLAADARADAGVLRLNLTRPEMSLPDREAGDFVAVLLVGTYATDEGPDVQASLTANDSEAGMMESVIRSVLEETGGALHTFATADGSPLYRVSLPGAMAAAQEADDEDAPLDLSPYVEGWSYCSRGRERHTHSSRGI